MAEQALTEPSPPPAPPGVEDKLKGVLSAMADAVEVILADTAIDRFGRAARLCVMGQKISGELVKSIKDAKKIRALEANQQAGMMGALGAEGQYIAQGGGDIDGFAEDMADQNILNGMAVMPRYHGGQFNDQTQLQRDLMMMVGEYFQDLKKSKAAPAELPPQSRGDIYYELNQAFRAIEALKLQDPASPHLAVLNQQVNLLMDKLAQGDRDDSQPAPTEIHLVPTELLRGHPPGAGEQWGNPPDPRGPVLHREGGGEGLDRGGEAHGAHEEAVG